MRDFDLEKYRGTCELRSKILGDEREWFSTVQVGT